jgi:MGT family glycosyltransferase
MKIAVMTSPELGHVHPMLGVAQWLRRDGHTVGWLGIPHARPSLARWFELLPLQGAPPPPPHVVGGEELARLVRTPALRGWIRTLLLDAVPDQIDPVRAALRRFGADAVILDPMLYQGVIACELDRTPYAAISSSLNPVTPIDVTCELTRTVEELAPARAALFARYGLAPSFRVCDCLSARVVTVFATRAYVGDVELPPRTHLVGPSIAPDGRDEPPLELPGAPERPIVYASFGSQISWQPRAFRTLAQAVAPLGVTLVLSAGDLVDSPELRDLPGDVIALRTAPQLQLLERTSVFVTHGGANSVMEAMTFGVPVVISPVCNDQFLQAWFVERAGVGIRLDVTTAPSEACRDAIASLLRPDAPARRRAAQVSASYRGHDGARAAARLVEEAVQR